jgi:diacylglycerol kinase (ATP)
MSRSVAILLNPASGKGRSAEYAPRLVDAFERRGVAAHVLTGDSAEHAVELGKQAVAGGVDALIAAGGDGTVNTAVQAVAETDTPLGIVSLGTGNDNATLLGLPVKDPEGAVDVACLFHERTVDVASVIAADGVRRYFLGVLSAGFDSLVTERANAMSWPKGEARYVLAMLAELRTFQPCEFTITIDGEVMTDRGMLAAVGNGVTYGGGMRVCEGALVDDGLLQLTWLHESTKWHFVRAFPKVYSGTHIEDPKVSQHAGRQIRIEAPGQLAYADGDRMGELPVDIAVHPGGLRVLTARSGYGRERGV